jgi:hypothetical protein
MDAPRPASHAVLRLPTLAVLQSSTGLLVATLALAALVTVAIMPNLFLQDSWLALVAGREVWQHGLPHHETLTALAAGSRWTDQQWLSQLAIYGLWRLGGLNLVGIVNVALVMCGVGGAVAAARRLGASTESVTRVLPVCLVALIFGAQVRTQAYAYPLFVGVLYLLAADSRAPSRRVYWCLPALILWANLHGSVTLGAGVVGLRGLTIGWEQRERLFRDLGSWTRPLALIVGPLLCLLATPYGLSIVSYYHDTLFNGSFRSAITEWQPVTFSPALAIPFFILAGVALWSFGRHAGQTTVFERCALLALGIAGVTAVRNVEWFALAGLMIVSLSIDAAAREREGRRARRSRSNVNAAIALAALLALAVAVVDAFGKPASAFEPSYSRGALAQVSAATAADPSLTVFAEDKYGDWLLWHDPSLRGRIAYDARFELLGSRRLRELVHLEDAVGIDWKRLARGYRLVVVDRKASPDGARGFEAEPGRRILYDHGGSLVVLRSASEAAR